jgi:hypothetical protein
VRSRLHAWVLEQRARHWFAHHDLRYEILELAACLYGHEAIDVEQFPSEPRIQDQAKG